MLRSAVLLLFVINLSRVQGGDLPKLEPPLNLRISRNSTGTNRRVVVHWNYAEPDNVPLRKVEFVLQLESEGETTRTYRTHFDSGYEFQFTLEGLLAETNYTVKLAATSRNWEASENSIETFVTLPVEWPTPVIVNVTSTVRANYDEFTLFWKMRELPGLLAGFEVRVCDNLCVAYLRNSTNNHARVPAQFNTEVNITVAALFDAYDTGPIERESKPYCGKSQMGEPGKILEVHGGLERNWVALDWHPPFHPIGPLSYYEIFVCDTSNKTNTFRNASFTGLDENIHALPLLGDAFELKLDTTRFNQTTASSKNGSLPLNYGGSEPPTPLLLVVVKRAPSCVRFRIFFLKPDRNSFSEISTTTTVKQLFLGSTIAENFNLSPYEIMHLKIRSCLTAASYRYSHDLCGNFADFEIRSNVAAPGPVWKPRMEFSSSDVLDLSWRMPKEPRGPIDGFKIYVEEGIPGYKDVTIDTVDQNTFSVDLQNYDSKKTYIIKIAAFNLDLENRTMEHVGEWHSFTLPSPSRLMLAKILTVISLICLILAITIPMLLVN